MSADIKTNNNNNSVNNSFNNTNEKESSSGNISPKNHVIFSSKNINFSKFFINNIKIQKDQQKESDNMSSASFHTPHNSQQKKTSILKKKKMKKNTKNSDKSINIEDNNLLMTEVKNEVTVIPKEDSKEIKFLKNKVQTLKIPLNINTIIKSELENTKTKIKKDFMKKNIEISNKKLSMNNLLKLKNKENENEVIHKINKDGIIYDIDAVTSRQLYHWKKDINFYKNELLKIETNQKIYESPSVKDMFRKKIFNDKNDQFNKQKNKIMQKIRTISEKINYILEDSKKLNKLQIIKNYSARNLNNDQEKFNNNLLELQKNEKLNREKLESDLKLSNEKRLKKLNLDRIASASNKKNLLDNIKQNDQQFCSNLKAKNDDIIKKYSKFMKKKNPRGVKDYLFYKFQENFDNNEKKLIEKVNMIKKEPLITKKEIRELSQKIKNQKLLIEESINDKKNKLLEAWKCREKTLPVYRHPIVEILEDEKQDNLEIQEKKQKQKINNELEKKNYKPPEVKISKKLKNIRESRNIKTNKENLIQTEINNKNRLLNSLTILPNIISSSKEDLNKKEKKLKDFKSFSETNIIKKIKKKKRKKKIIKSPEYTLHPKPDKPIDYLKEISVKQHKQKESDGLLLINKDLEEKKNIIGSELIDRIKIARSKVELLDQKVGEKKEFLKVAGGYIQNTKLGDEVGNLLIKSIQAKLGIMNKMNGV